AHAPVVADVVRVVWIPRIDVATGAVQDDRNACRAERRAQLVGERPRPVGGDDWLGEDVDRVAGVAQKHRREAERAFAKTQNAQLRVDGAFEIAAARVYPAAASGHSNRAVAHDHPTIEGDPAFDPTPDAELDRSEHGVGFLEAAVDPLQSVRMVPVIAA